MDCANFIKGMRLYNDAHPERNYSYVEDVPSNFHIPLQKDHMYIVFPSSYKEDRIIDSMNALFGSFLEKTYYTFTYKILHNVILDDIVSKIDESENFDNESITIELQGMPKHEVFIVAEVLSKYSRVQYSSVMVIDPKEAGYYIGDFYTEYEEDNEDDEIYESLNESSINRIVDWLDKYDIACISATRCMYNNATNRTYDDRPDEYKKADAPYRYTNKENRARNSHLKAALLKKGYGVTNIQGSYIEAYRDKNPIERSEPSMFVVNLNNDPDFFTNIFELSEFYNQDSFLYKKKGTDCAFLVGTNNGEFPGYGETVAQGDRHTNIKSEFFSRLGNRSFAFVKDLSLQHNDMDSDFLKRKQDRIDRQLADSLDTYETQSVNAKNIITDWSKEVNNVMESFNK